jgi:hypothetical protein
MTPTRFATAAAILYAGRRYYRNWGATKDECETPLPGDELVADPALQTTDAVWIDASPAVVWPWLIQVGQDRGGLYTYQRLQNLLGLHYRNAERIEADWQHLSVGDTVRLTPPNWLGFPEGLTLRVAGIVDQQSIVLRARPPWHIFDAVWSVHLIPHWDDRCRLLIRNRIRLRYFGEVLALEFAGPVAALLTRGTLRGIKHRVHRSISTPAFDIRSNTTHPDSNAMRKLPQSAS